jgi:hypothetical protein
MGEVRPSPGKRYRSITIMHTALDFILLPNSAVGTDAARALFASMTARIRLDYEGIRECLAEIHRPARYGPQDAPPGVRVIRRGLVDRPEHRLALVRASRPRAHSEAAQAEVPPEIPPKSLDALLEAISYDGRGRAVLPGALGKPGSARMVATEETWRRALPGAGSMLWTARLGEGADGEVSFHPLEAGELERGLALLAPPEKERETFAYLAEHRPDVAVEWLAGEMRWPGTNETRRPPRQISRSECAPLLGAASADVRIRAIGLLNSLEGAADAGTAAHA